MKPILRNACFIAVTCILYFFFVINRCLRVIRTLNRHKPSFKGNLVSLYDITTHHRNSACLLFPRALCTKQVSKNARTQFQMYPLQHTKEFDLELLNKCVMSYARNTSCNRALTIYSVCSEY